VFLKPELTANQHIYISSFTTTQNDVLAVLEKVSGSSWQVSKVSSKTQVREAREALAAGVHFWEPFRALLLAVSYTAGNGSDFRGRDFNEALQLPKEDMEEVVAQIIKDQEASKLTKP
jgi:hypothetical protein